MAKAAKTIKPRRPIGLPHGRWLGDIGRLSAVERRLIDHCARGEPFVMNAARPEKPTSANRVRAQLIRFLLLGGDEQHPVHEEGVMIGGGWIYGTLVLHQAKCQVRLIARNCHFDHPIEAMAATIPELGLSGSIFPGLRADRIKVAGGVFLRGGCTATGEVRLLGAKIGGNLSCRDSQFSNEHGKALNADRISIKGTASLGRGFVAKGEISMLGAVIGGNVECSGGSFENKDGQAINLDGARISDGLFFRDATFTGAIDLTTAFAGTFLDDDTCYDGTTLILDGFQYNRIMGPIDATERVAWLNRQPSSNLGEDFRPQPWEQLIKVLREMGHLAQAAEIAIEKQRMLLRARKIGRRKANPKFTVPLSWLNRAWVWLTNKIARGLHAFYGAIAGYGHRPSRIVIWMLIVCMLCSLAFYGGRERGLIGPSAPVIQLHPRLARCGTGGDPGAIQWTSPDCPVPPEYSTFQPFFYSLDVIIPFVDLHQEADWGPVVTNKSGETLWWGRVLRWIMWFEIIFGWVASVMFVAIIGRLVDKD